MNCKNIWLTIEEVCSLTGDKFETIRRKCKSGKLETRFEKDGKFKKYFIQISSLSLELQEKHLNQLNEPKKLAVITSNIDESINKYSNAPCWAKKFVDKYLELFAATEKMNYKEKTEFLKDWNKKYPDKKCSYSSLTEAKRKYKIAGAGALLCKYGHKNNAISIKKEYFDYFKTLYLREGAPSAQSSWLIVLGYRSIYE